MVWHMIPKIPSSNELHATLGSQPYIVIQVLSTSADILGFIHALLGRATLIHNLMMINIPGFFDDKYLNLFYSTLNRPSERVSSATLTLIKSPLFILLWLSL